MATPLPTKTTSSPPLPIPTSATSRTAVATNPSSPLLASRFKRKTMSITQTYFLAHKARAKLSHQAALPDHDLRLLVGHANLLDSLMLDLADAEREQESWFNQSVKGATRAQDRHIRWADSAVEEPEQDWQAEDADSDLSSDSDDSDFDEDEDEDVEMADAVSLRRVPSNKSTPILRNTDTDFDDVEEDDDDEEDFAQLTLTRSPSHSSSPPELELDLDDSEDESMPPSPPTAALSTFTEKEEESSATTSYYDTRHGKDNFYAEEFYVPPRNPGRLVSAISVY